MKTQKIWALTHWTTEEFNALINSGLKVRSYNQEGFTIVQAGKNFRVAAQPNIEIITDSESEETYLRLILNDSKALMLISSTVSTDYNFFITNYV